MSRFWAHLKTNFYRILVSLLGLVVLFYILISFRIWSMDWTDYFIKVGRWEEIIFVSLIVAGISMVLIKLYQWHIRLQTGGR